MEKYIAVNKCTLSGETLDTGVLGTAVSIPNFLPMNLIEGKPVFLDRCLFLGTQCTLHESIIRFKSTTITVTPEVGSTYTNNSNEFEVLRTGVEPGPAPQNTIIVTKKISGSNPLSGTTLTKTSGVGDSSITFNTSVDPKVTFVTGGGVISASATNSYLDDLKPLREDDTGVCRGIFIVDGLNILCSCNITIDNANQSTTIWE